MTAQKLLNHTRSCAALTVCHAHLVQAVEYAAHNYSLFLLGVMILWFGWYGFNPGSALAILPAGFSLPVQQVPN